MGIPTSCFILFTGFRTVFVFALGRFVPVVVNFLSPQSIQKGKNGKKKQNFKIGLKPTQNCETPKTKVSFTILGGSWRQKVVSVFLYRHPKCHFLARENGHFWQKCPFSRAKKWHLGCRHKQTETPSFVLGVQQFWVGFKQILKEILLFFAVFPLLN